MFVAGKPLKMRCYSVHQNFQPLFSLTPASDEELVDDDDEADLNEDDEYDDDLSSKSISLSVANPADDDEAAKLAPACLENVSVMNVVTSMKRSTQLVMQPSVL